MGKECAPLQIMIVEDNEKIRQELSSFLARYGYTIYAPDTFDHIFDDILGQKPDLLLLDLALPVYDGLYICREVRKVSAMPILIVTSKDTEMDELMSLNVGADDFITKPYNTQILLARIAALLKRANGAAVNDRLVCGDFALNLSACAVEYQGKSLELTTNEQKILHCLIQHKGAVVSRDDLMNHLWNSNLFVDENTLNVNINRLRKKLEGIGLVDVIQTKRGQGYRIP